MRPGSSLMEPLLFIKSHVSAYSRLRYRVQITGKPTFAINIHNTIKFDIVAGSVKQLLALLSRVKVTDGGINVLQRVGG